jgi:heat shock protein HtpX
MGMAKRIGVFLLVNILVISTISIVFSVFNIQPYLTQRGINPFSLMIFCLIWGMGGAFISLLLSKYMAKWMMGVKIVDAHTRDPIQQELIRTVHSLAKEAGLPKMPEVGIYESPEINAFATGRSRRSSLVAVSTGLLQRMNHDQVDGVVGHEIAHIANGDMVTMTLVQGVINAFVMFMARILAFAIMRAMSRGDSRNVSRSFAYHGLVFALQMVFMIFGSMVVSAYSRWREFHADKGGAKYAGRQKMISALEGLQQMHNIQDPKTNQEAFQAFKISNTSKMAHLFATHPPLEERIRRLKEAS